jgi:hypothetical protein
LLTALPMPAEPLGLAAFEGAAEPATVLAFSPLGSRGLNRIDLGIFYPSEKEALP